MIHVESNVALGVGLVMPPGHMMALWFALSKKSIPQMPDAVALVPNERTLIHPWNVLPHG